MDPINLVIHWLCFIEPTNIVTECQTHSFEVVRVKQGARNNFKLPRQNNPLFFLGIIMVQIILGSPLGSSVTESKVVINILWTQLIL